MIMPYEINAVELDEIARMFDTFTPKTMQECRDFVNSLMRRSYEAGIESGKARLRDSLLGSLCDAIAHV